MSVTSKTKSAVKVVVSTSLTNEEYHKREQDRRMEEKINILDRCESSQDVFNELAQAISTLSNDESCDDFSVDDDYNDGTQYTIDILLELTNDLRWFTRLDKEGDDKFITELNLDYLRSYF